MTTSTHSTRHLFEDCVCYPFRVIYPWRIHEAGVYLQETFKYYGNADSGSDNKRVSFCTSLASMTVPTPTVKEDFGTLLTSPPKNLAFASMVSTARDLIRVRETSEEPGSLNAM